MKNWMKIVLGVALSFMVLFIGVGYAALTDHLTIFGKAEITIPEGLFIIAMDREGTSNLNLDSRYYSHSFAPYSTVADVQLRKSSSNSSAWAKYKITVFNNTKRTYAYRDEYYQTDLSGYNNNIINENGGNSNIRITTEFPNGNKVEPGETLEFYVTYTLGSRLSRNTTYKTLVNYQFGINVDSIEEAKEAVFEKFLNILNSPSTYKTLCERIDDKFNGQEWSSNFIGNVTASYSEDSATVEELFAGQLNLTIGNESQRVTVLIKHENVDNRRDTGDDYTAVNGNQSFSGYGCEFTLYMTTSALNNRNEKPPIYAAVFTCDRNADGSCGSLYMLGEPYYGTAQIVGYEGGETTGSFDTGTWRSYAETYTPIDGYSYQLANNLTIQQVTQAIDANATAVLEQMLTEAKKILDDNIYAGSGMEALEKTYFAYMDASDLYDVDANGNITVKAGVTRSQIVPHLKKIANALKAFEGVQP
jgi:hypothetical protein